MNQSIKKISTYAELQYEKQKLRQEIHISKAELLRSLDTTRSTAKSILLKGVVLPAGIAGLTVAGVKVAQNLRNDQDDSKTEDYIQYGAAGPTNIVETVKASLASSSKWYFRLIPIAFQLIRTYLANRKNYQQAHIEAIHSYPMESKSSLPVQSYSLH